jgi:plastocyanin
MFPRASHPRRTQLPLLPCAAVLVGALSALPAGAAPAAHAHRTYLVVIEDMRFTPAVLSIRRGDRVVWINKDLFPHTVTADARNFESGDIAATRSWSYHATSAGEYAYSCRFHPGMKGRFTVQP